MRSGAGESWARREVLAVLAAATGLVIVTGATPLARAIAASPAASVGPAADAVRRLMALATRNAFVKLSRPDGFWSSPVARVPLPKLFNPNGAYPGPLASPAFRDDLAHRLNAIAGAGARRIAPIVDRSARRGIVVADPAAALHGGPTAATTLLRAEIGPRAVNTLTPALAAELRRVRDPIIRRATSALKGVTTNDVARALGNGAEGAIWYAIGAEEAAIRRDPASSGDPVLAMALAGG